MEKIVLSSPVQADPGATEFEVCRLVLDWKQASSVNPDPGRIEVTLVEVGTSSRELSFVYTGTVARDLMKALNKADLSVKSLHRRIIERLQADGKLGPGSIVGSPA